MEASKKAGNPANSHEKIINDIRAVIRKYKNIVVGGEEGVGKITNTLEALKDMDTIFYIGNPVDYIGKPRPKGYDKYINYIMSLKKDMHVIASDREILSLDSAFFKERESILVIDEVYGRSVEQYEKIITILAMKRVKVLLITGCLKNIGKIVQDIDIAIMLAQDGILTIEKEFAMKICSILKSETL